MKLIGACIAAALVLLIAPKAQSSCPPSIYSKRYLNGKCYSQITSLKNWQDAKAYCESASNGRLLAINSYTERSSLRYWISSGSASWTSGYSNDTILAVTTTPTTAYDNITTSGADFSNSSDANTTDSLTTSTETLTTTTSIITRGTTLAPMRWYWSGPQGVDTRIFSFYWSSTPVRRNGPSCLAISRYGSYYSLDCAGRRKFVCEYDCKNYINSGNTTTISSPGYPSPYSNSAYCEWFVDVGEGRAILEFSAFKTEGSSSGSCSLDYVLVAENASTISRPLGRFCGSSLPRNIESPSQFLYIRFVTDGSVSYEGFRATVRSSNVPVTKMLDGKHGVATSPQFPRNYLANVTTNWLISVTYGYVILNFTEFSLQSSADCVADRLEIRDSSATGRLISTLCGTTLPEGIRTNSSVVHLSLISNDDETQGAGFRVIYSSNTASCVHIINSGGGTITTPGYPSNYPSYLSCVWYIDVMDGVAKINFTDFQVDYSSRCSQDRLEIWDGRLNNGSRIGSYYCGSTRPRGVISSRSRYLTLFFKTNYYASDNGFLATFRSSLNCSQTFNASKGVVLSPNYPSYYDPYSNCTWIIDVLSGNATLEFNSFSIQQHQTCANDKITIYDGNTTNAPSLGEFCGRNNPGRIVASGRYILIHMVADGSFGSSGFSADFWSTDLNCTMFRQMDAAMMYNNTCYGLSKRSSTSFTSAQSVCERLNASSVFIESRGEYNALASWLYSGNLYSYNTVWTSGLKRNNKWFWRTLEGDVPLDDSLHKDHVWGAGQPSSSSSYAYIRMGSAGLISSNSYSSGSALCKERSLAHNTKPLSKHGCTAPPNIYNGYYIPYNIPYFTNGSSVTYKCDLNFKFPATNTTTMTCINGNWNRKAPICRKIDESNSCYRPPTVANGRFIPNLPYHLNGSVVQFECVDGYELVSPKYENLTCLRKHWQGYVPSCTLEIDESNSCYRPPTVALGKFIPNLPSHLNGSVVQFECVDGYELVNPKYENLTCLQKHWQGYVPSCTLGTGSGSVVKPQKQVDEGGKSDKYNGLLAGTLTAIIVLVIVVVLGVVWFFVKYRSGISRERLIEMQAQ